MTAMLPDIEQVNLQVYSVKDQMRIMDQRVTKTENDIFVHENLESQLRSV